MTHYETRGVLAGAYRESSPKSMLTHVVELDAEGNELRVLCRRVQLDSMADRYAGVDTTEPATCLVCARRDPRRLAPNDSYSPFAGHDRIPGGRADYRDPSEFDPVELARGTAHEMEHTDDPELAAEIARDHLIEDEAYYTHLDAMERQSFRSNRLRRRSSATVETDERYPYSSYLGSGVAPYQFQLSHNKVIIYHASTFKGSATFKKGVWVAERYTPVPSAEIMAVLAREAPNGPVDIRATLTEHQPNAGYYVWVLDAHGLPMQTEGPHGPHDLQGAKTYARIAATEGRHDRAVSRGKDPETPSFTIVRAYRAGSGERLV